MDQWCICVNVGQPGSWYIQEVHAGVVVTPCRGLATRYESEDEYKQVLSFINSYTFIHQSLVWVEKV